MRKSQLCTVPREEFQAASAKVLVCSRSSRYLSHEVAREASEIWDRKNLYKHKEFLQLVTSLQRQSRPTFSHLLSSVLGKHGPWRPPATHSSAEIVPCSVGNRTRGL